MGQLDGKVAVVTAASRGIGLAITKKYVDEGAIVYMAVRDSEKNRNLTDEMHQELANQSQLFYMKQAQVINSLFDQMNEKYEKEHPNAKPVYHEHGWHLAEDDD